MGALHTTLELKICEECDCLVRLSVCECERVGTWVDVGFVEWGRGRLALADGAGAMVRFVDYLERLAEAHLVCQDGRVSVGVALSEPAQALELGIQRGASVRVQDQAFKFT